MTTDHVAFTLAIEDLDEKLTVTDLRGEEGINMLYAFELCASSERKELDFEAIVGKAGMITLTKGELTRSITGIISAFEQADTSEARTHYYVHLVPEAWLLAQGTRCRIFQGLTIPEVIARVFEEAAVAYRASLLGSYEAHEICVQYHESDWTLVCRLMEEAGIFYFYEGNELVIADHTGVHEPLGGGGEEIAYMPATEALEAGECIQSFRFASRIRPGRVALRQVPFDTPTRASEDEAEYSRDTNLEVYGYPALSSASSRLDALQVARKVAKGMARSVRLAPGAKFKLVGHPRPSFDESYLITRVEHVLSSQRELSVYNASFECIPASTPCRPLPLTKKPSIKGPQAAQVVGPSGNEIHVDDKGRVLVKLEWTRGEEGDLSEACWMHVSQGTTGAGFGAVHIPRVGSYVLVEFLNGDPDRPIITGRVYNSLSPYPYKLPDEKTKSTLKTQTTPGGDGYNELRFEDQAGREEVYLRAQRNLEIEAQRDTTRKVGSDDALFVGGERSAKIAGSETHEVALAQSVAVGLAQSIAVGAARSLTVVGDHSEGVGGDHNEEITGSWSRAVGGDSSESVAGSQSAEVGGDKSVLITGNEALEVGGNQSLSVSGNQQALIEGEAFLSAGALTVVVSGDTTTRGAGEVKLESETALKLGGPYVYVSGDSTIHVRAYDKIVLEVAASDEEGADSAKLEITKDGVYLTNGSVVKDLTGDKISFNC